MFIKKGVFSLLSQRDSPESHIKEVWGRCFGKSERVGKSILSSWLPSFLSCIMWPVGCAVMAVNAQIPCCSQSQPLRSVALAIGSCVWTDQGQGPFSTTTFQFCRTYETYPRKEHWKSLVSGTGKLFRASWESQAWGALSGSPWGSWSSDSCNSNRRNGMVLGETEGLWSSPQLEVYFTWHKHHHHGDEYLFSEK